MATVLSAAGMIAMIKGDDLEALLPEIEKIQAELLTANDDIEAEHAMMRGSKASLSG